MKKYFIAAILVAVFLNLISCAPTLKLLGKNILIDDSHLNLNGADISDYFGEMIKTLEENYHTVDISEETGFYPTNYDIVIISAPFEFYNYTEKNEIYDFLESGGTLIVLGENGGYWNSTYLNNLLSYLGVDILFEQNTLYDNDNYYNSVNWIRVSEFEDHSLTNYLSEIVLFIACGLDVFDTASYVAYSTTANVYTETFNEKQNKINLSSPESLSDFDIYNPQISIELPLVAIDNISSGKVVAIPDTGIFCDEEVGGYMMIDIYDNEQLLLNIINW